MIGRRLSQYRIHERLGAGGMGEVYRARDERLGRDVAIKVLPPGTLDDSEARRRFRNEAAILSRLSHPHVATLLDFDKVDGVDYLAMELVVGPTLEQEVRKGPLAEKDVVRLGAQLARGLGAAHEQGVIHRDLKPSNLQLTADGLLKILDFGVARLDLGPAAASDDAADTADVATAAGAVLGSPPYMAPEQLLGQEVDARTDVYAAGACLYELATGRRPHGDKRGAQLTAAILSEAPTPPREVNAAISPGLEAVILKALDKDQALRYQTARDLLVDLERLQQRSGASTGATVVAVRPRRVRRWLVVGIAGLVGLGAVAWLRQPRPPRVTSIRALTAGIEGVDIDSGWATDGARIYFLVKGRSGKTFYQIPVTGGEATPLPPVVPGNFNQTICGYLARESALLMTASEKEGWLERGAPLWTIPVPSGTPSRLGTIEAVTAALSPDGETLAVSQYPDRLALIHRDGKLIREWTHFQTPPARLAWSPDGEKIRFSTLSTDWSQVSIWEVPVRGGSPRPFASGSGGQWSDDGSYYFFVRYGHSFARSDIFAVREPGFPWFWQGAQFHLTPGPTSFELPAPAKDGSRLFAMGLNALGEMLRYDQRSGRFEKYLGGASIYAVEASSDGKWLAWVTYPDGVLWKSRSDGSDRARLTGPGWRMLVPHWSPDNTRLSVSCEKWGQFRVLSCIVNRDGGQVEVVDETMNGAPQFESFWTPDGKSLISSLSVYGGELGIRKFDLATRQSSILPGAERLVWPKVSPRGDILGMELTGLRAIHWAYFVDQGRWERLGPLDIAYPVWSKDGSSFTGILWSSPKIVRWSRATRRIEPVADLSEIPLLIWISPWMGFAPDGSPLVVRDRSTRDLYALDWEAP